MDIPVEPSRSGKNFIVIEGEVRANDICFASR